ncbi:MAG: M20/M25/M40 family metallo-hydrolase, partial [Spirochaetota bacterium]
GPGIGDNSLGVAALLALATAYGAAAREARDGEAELVRPACDIWLVANAGEEGLGDLRGIRTALDHVRSRTPRGVGAAIVLEGLALGGVYHRGIGVKRFRLEVRTPGGHSWADFGSPSAVHELLLRLARIVKLKIPSAPRSSINVGTIEGGTSINSIASHARAEIDLRSESAAGVEELVRRVADATGCSSEEDGGRGGLRGIGAALGRAFGAAREGGVQARLVPIGDRPAAEIPADHPLVDAAVRALAAVGLRAELRTGSTDANALLAGGVPTVCVGISTGAHAHRVDEYVNVDPIERGLKQLGHLIPEAAAVAARHQDEGRTR